MKKKYAAFLFWFLYLTFPAFTQEPVTIRVRKEQNLAKAIFDNVERRLMVVDRFGNLRENKIATYKLFIKTKRQTKEFSAYGNVLNSEILAYMVGLKHASKLFFTEIMAVDDEGHPVKLPDVVETWFPSCLNCAK